MDNPKEKVAVLMWDELELNTHLDYDPKGDLIVGVEDWSPGTVTIGKNMLPKSYGYSQ